VCDDRKGVTALFEMPVVINKRRRLVFACVYGRCVYAPR
jgi:hypothetical protein